MSHPEYRPCIDACFRRAEACGQCRRPGRGPTGWRKTCVVQDRDIMHVLAST